MIEEIATSMGTYHHVRVQVTGKTVRIGDVIDFGGRGFTVVYVLDFSNGTRGLRFRTGEELFVEPDEELSAVRTIRKR